MKFNMKTIIIVMTVCLAAFSSAATEEELRDACIKDTGASLDAVEKAYKQNEWADDSKLRCYSVCMMRKWGLVEERDGSWIPNAIRDFVGKTYPFATVDEIMTKCPLMFDASCSTAYLLQKCWGDLKLAAKA